MATPPDSGQPARLTAEYQRFAVTVAGWLTVLRDYVPAPVAAQFDRTAQQYRDLAAALAAQLERENRTHDR